MVLEEMLAAAKGAMTGMAETAAEVITQAFAQGMVLGPRTTVTVTASNCTSVKRKQVEQLVASKFAYHNSCSAPCCLKGPLPNVSISERMDWSRFGNSEKQATAWGRDWLQKNLAPPGVVVLAVQDARWLDCTVDFLEGCVKIESSATDYIFVDEEAWEKCWEEHRAELIKVQQLEAAAGSSDGVKGSLTKDAVLSLTGSVLAFYEAKTDASLKKLDSVRGQALLQYLAINHMRNWPMRDIIVIFGNFNNNYTIHAGHQDSGGLKSSLHVAGPPSALSAVLEHGRNSSHSSSPSSVNAGFIQALMRPPQIDEVSAHEAVEAPGDEGPSSGGRRGGSGGEGAGGRGGGGPGRGGSTQAGSSSSSGGGAGGGGGAAAAGSSKQAGTSNGNGEEAGGAGSSSAGSSRTSSPDSGSSGGERFDADEGLLEAAQDNFFAQAFMSVLRQPAVYQGVLKQDAPPTSFQPPTREELMEKFAAMLVKVKLHADQRQ
ncbi:hypothetical protein TSOC_007567 [Tetrabaena socialis]|uniref:Uncharacterized protein n=1 Tax=Tetrabaena socialis TaxID=47790 RepID=A0A2J8A0T5_9CHLO|nr:hypothetical protein TSOC_007567 [Tetrabaena socialis]|eukprot:PNH06115.1 hypothetical protein TSOC_007567 [Tetrabaena socialis]